MTDLPPTQEELDKAIADAASVDPNTPDPEQEDPLKDPENPNFVEEEKETPPQKESEDDQEEQEEEKEEEEQTEDAEIEEVEEEKQEDKEPDYKEKFKQSTRNAQVLAEDKKELEEEIDKAYELPEPTEEQLQKEYPEWDTLSDFEKRLAKSDLHNRQINERIRQIRFDQRERKSKIAEFIQELDVYTIKPDTLKKYPLLEGKQKALKEFAQEVPTRIGMAKDDLIELFLVKTAEKRVSKKGKMFETGESRSSTPEKGNDGMITLSQASALMKSNYDEYKKMLNAGKIDFSSI